MIQGPIEPILGALLIAAITLAALAFVGFGLTRLLLPRALGAEGLLWVPFVGYTLASIVYHALNVQYLDGVRSTLVLFAIGAALNVAAVVVGPSIRAPRPWVCAALAALTVIVFVVGVAPLAAIGQLTAIARNYDLIDIYDATAAYIIKSPVNSILASNPPNPLANTVTSPGPLSNGWGLSYLHALASILSDRSAIETQAPVFSLMHALLVPSAFILLRRSFGVPVGLALATCAAIGLHGMTVSMLLVGLGNHTAILALLPVVFASTLLAINDPRPRTIAFAGFMLANIPLTYWAAFPFYVPPVLIYALIGPRFRLVAIWLLVKQLSSRRGRVVGQPRWWADPPAPAAGQRASDRFRTRQVHVAAQARNGATLESGNPPSARVPAASGVPALGYMLLDLADGVFAFDEGEVGDGDGDGLPLLPLIDRLSAALGLGLPPTASVATVGDRPPAVLTGSGLTREGVVALARLLATTGKSGRLRIADRAWAGEIRISSGRLVGANVQKRDGLSRGDFTPADGWFAIEAAPDVNGHGGGVVLPASDSVVGAGGLNGHPRGPEVAPDIGGAAAETAIGSPVHGVVGQRGALKRLTRRLLVVLDAPVRRYLALAALVVVSIPLALPGYQRMVPSLVNLGGASKGWGLSGFVDVGLLAGTSYWTYPAPTDVRAIFGQAPGTLLLAVEWAVLVSCVLLAGYALGRPFARGGAALLSLTVSYAALLLYWRFVSAYPYAFLKAMSFGALPVLTLLAVGLARVWQARVARVGRWRLATRPVAVALAGVMVALALFNTALTTAFFFNQTPTVFTGSVLPPSVLELSQLAAKLPAGAPVFIGQTPPMRPEATSALAFYIRDHPLYGQINTLESDLSNPSPGGRVQQFGVLAASEDPSDEGYAPGDVVWSNADVKLYRRGGVLAHWRFEGAGSLTLGPSAPLHITLRPDAIYLGDAPPDTQAGTPAPRQLVVELGTLEARMLRVVVDGQSRSVSLPAGVSQYSTELISTPAQVEVSVDGGSPVFVRSISLQDPANASESVLAERDVLVVSPRVETSGAQVRLDLQYAGAELWTPRMALGLNVGGNTTQDGKWSEFGWWGTSLGGSSLSVGMDLSTKNVTATTLTGDQRVNSSPGDSPDGTYSATLNFWEPTQASLGRHSPFYPLFTFQIQDGQVVNTAASAAPVIFLPWRDTYQTASSEGADSLDGEMAAVHDALPPTARVLLGPQLRQQPTLVAALVRSLSGADFYADFLTGAHYAEAGRVYDYAILDPADDPATFGYSSGDRLIAGADVAVYKHGGDLVHLELGDATGYPRALDSQALTFQVGPDSVIAGPPGAKPDSPPGVERQIRLRFASFRPTSAQVAIGGEPVRMVQIPAGVSEYETEPVPVPTTISVGGPNVDSPFVLSLDLTAPASTTPATTRVEDVLLLSTRGEQTGPGQLGLDVQWAASSSVARTFYLGVNLNGFAAEDGHWLPSAWWGVPMVGGLLHLDLDLATRSLTASSAGRPGPVTSSLFESPDGDYTAELSLWEPTLARNGWRSPFVRLFDAQTRSGTVVTLVPHTSLTVVSLVAADAAATSAAPSARP